MNSTASSGVMIPPMPMTGTFTARALSYTMRTAMGLMAGPESPPVVFVRRGLRVSISIDSARKVLTSDMASAPELAATRAIWAMDVTFGESLTMSGRLVAERAEETRYSSEPGWAPKLMPPAWTVGQGT